MADLKRVDGGRFLNLSKLSIADILKFGYQSKRIDSNVFDDRFVRLLCLSIFVISRKSFENKLLNGGLLLCEGNLRFWNFCLGQFEHARKTVIQVR